MKAFIELTDALEKGIAEGTLRNRTAIVGALRSIENAATSMSNHGLPPGTKSIALRIKKLSADMRMGLENRELSAKEFREIVRDKFGQLNTAFKQNVQGKLSADNKAAVREGHIRQGADHEAEVTRLLEEIHFKEGVIRGKHSWYASQLNDAIADMLEQMTLGELRAIDMEAFRAISPDDVIQGITHGFGHIKRNLLHKSDSEYSQLSESYKHLTKLLPRHVNVAKAISYPVVPLFNDIDALKNPGKLESAGFDVTQVGDHFIVLENQFILCVDTEELGFGKTLKLSRDKVKLRGLKGAAALTEADKTAAAVHEFLDQINLRSNVKYALASDTIVRNPLNAKIALIWLIPEKTRHVLEQTLRTRKVDWDIPRHELTTDE